MSSPGQVSVVIPTTGSRPAALGRAIASAVGQTRLPLEVLVVDDGSAPAPVLEHPLVRVVTPPRRNGDAGAARNAGAAAARGDLVAFLDDDDMWHSDKLARQLAALDGADAIACGFDVVDDEGRLVERHRPVSDDLRRDLLLRPILQPSALVVRREALLTAGGFAEGLRRCEDWALFLRLAERGEIVLQPEVLVTRAPSDATPADQLAALARFYRSEIAPRATAADRARVEAHHRLVAGVLLAQSGRRRAAARLLWRSGARLQLLRLVSGERLWDAVLRATRRHRRVARG